MSNENKYCENCRHYKHEPSIIGGTTECMLLVKSLMTFWRNDACEKYSEKSQESVSESQMNNRMSELLHQLKLPQ